MAKNIKNRDHLIFNNLHPLSVRLKAFSKTIFNKFILNPTLQIIKAAAKTKLTIVGLSLINVSSCNRKSTAWSLH